MPVPSAVPLPSIFECRTVSSLPVSLQIPKRSVLIFDFSMVSWALLTMANHETAGPPVKLRFFKTTRVPAPDVVRILPAP
jgi:hypothetical protein